MHIKYGPKCSRLLFLKKCSSLSDYIPNIYPISIDILNGLDYDKIADDSIVDIATNYIKRKNTSMVNSIINCCGNAPWIVRSSGYEDDDLFTNAGGYESLICNNESDLYKTIIKVMFSGRKSHSVNQNKIFNNLLVRKPIPIFVQRLIKNESSYRSSEDTCPYISNEYLKSIVKVLKSTHGTLSLEKLDCEWVIDTDYGIISITSLSTYNEKSFICRFDCAFGFASAQNVNGNIGSAFIYDENVFWDKNQYILIDKIEKINLVQVRPQNIFNYNTSVPTIKNVDELKLKYSFNSFEEVIVKSSEKFFGYFIAKNTLNQAWEYYINLSKEQQSKINIIVVEKGSESEHAAIMFASINIPVIKIYNIDILSKYDYILIDQINLLLFYGLKQIDVNDFIIEKVQSIYIPNSAAYVFENKGNEKQLIKKYNDFISEVNNLSIPTITKLKIIKNSYNLDINFKILSKDEIYFPSFVGMCIYYNIMLDYNSLTNDEKVYYSYINNIQSDCFLQKLKSICEVDDYINIAQYIKENNNYLQFIKDFINDYELSCNNGYYIKILITVLERISSSILLTEREKIFVIQEVFNLLQNDNLNIDDILFCLKKSVVSIYLDINIIKNSSYLKLYNAFVKDLQDFKNIENAITTFHRMLDYNNLFCDINYLAYFKLIEVFDENAKNIATNCIYDQQNFQIYADILEKWLMLLSLLDFDGITCSNINILIKKLSFNLEQDFNIININLYDTLNSIKIGDSLPINNLHQVHNILHQWSLHNNFFIIKYDGLPEQVHKMIKVANQSNSGLRNVLLLYDDKVELEQNSYGHKSSILIQKGQVFIEHNETPDASDEEIGRILSLNKMMKKFCEWIPNYYFESTCNKVLGTWYLFINIKKRNEIFDYNYIYYLFNFIFDSVNDFGYEPNDVSNSIENRFNNSCWIDIINSFIKYRMNFFCNDNYVSYSISTILTDLIKNPQYEIFLENSYISGFKYCINEIYKYEKNLFVSEFDVWVDMFNKIKILSLLIVSVWPHKCCEYLNNKNMFSLADWFILRDVNHNSKYCDCINKIEYNINFTEIFIKNFIIKCINDETGEKYEDNLLIENTLSKTEKESICKRISTFFNIEKLILIDFSFENIYKCVISVINNGK